MKTVAILVFASLFGMSAFAQGGASAPAAQPQAAAATAPAKVSYKEAKKDCLSTDAKLKGKDLQKCIKGKQGKM